MNSDCHVSLCGFFEFFYFEFFNIFLKYTCVNPGACHVSLRGFFEFFILFFFEFFFFYFLIFLNVHVLTQ